MASLHHDKNDNNTNFPPRRCRIPMTTLIVLLVLALFPSVTSAQSSSSTTFSVTLNDDATSTNSNNFTNSKDLAELVLAQLEEEDYLTTPFSQRDTVLQRGFPKEWDACALPPPPTSLSSNSNNSNNSTDDSSYNIVVMGGSSAARPGDGCNTTEDPYRGRYSNLLQERLEEHAPHTRWRVWNMAQGAEVSVRGALFLDGYLPASVDLIVWDYSINDDGVAGGHAEEVRKLDFWLTRLGVQFQARQQKPRPILLLYLWEGRAGIELVRKTIDTLDKRPMDYIADLLDNKYADWDIAVLNVGAAVDSTFLSRNLDTVKLLFDDTQHPSCKGTQFIADMIEYALWSHWAKNENCTSSQTGVGLQVEAERSLSRSSSWDDLNEEEQSNATQQLYHPWPDSGTRLEDLWVDLFDPNAIIGSISPWVPRIPGQSNLHYQIGTVGTTASEEQERWAAWPMEVIPMHTENTREDKKFGYGLPRCNSDDDNQLQWECTLLEPQLKWLGLALRGSPMDILQLTINNVTFDGDALQQIKVDKWNYGLTYITHWIRMDDYFSPTDNNQYTVSACHTSSLDDEQIRQRNWGELPNLSYLIGVISPNIT